MSLLRRLLRRRRPDVVIDLTDSSPEFRVAVERLAELLPAQRCPRGDAVWKEYR